MLKQVFMLGDEIINVGEWDYKIEKDEEGNEVIENPLPEGAYVVEKEMKWIEEIGWKPIDWVKPLTQQEQLERDYADLVIKLVTEGIL